MRPITISAIARAGIARRHGLFGALALLALTACGAEQTAPPSPITVFAAASLTDALTEIAEDYEASTGRTVRLSFAASGAVARQVEAGAPADIVILADPTWMDRLAEAGSIAPDSRRDLIGNRLVVIAGTDARIDGDPIDWAVRTGARIAIGDPESVPAGAYARSWLQETGRWATLEPRPVMGADVRAVRAFVERGEVAVGIVYRSDAVGVSGLRIVLEPPASEQPPIVYPAALTRSANPLAADFLGRLGAPESAEILRRHGFEPLT